MRPTATPSTTECRGSWATRGCRRPRRRHDGWISPDPMRPQALRRQRGILQQRPRVRQVRRGHRRESSRSASTRLENWYEETATERIPGGASQKTWRRQPTTRRRGRTTWRTSPSWCPIARTAMAQQWIQEQHATRIPAASAGDDRHRLLEQTRRFRLRNHRRHESAREALGHGDQLREGGTKEEERRRQHESGGVERQNREDREQR